ncbi:hypothetical protein JAAARDRAFT_191276 [Jaapia argillacea MUCL 33604]|uniref:TAP42-like protein n=1 Tax=Jaapia argillacea MUCL 33604 TaxID=933084 RepID=A0A067Q272_9AGAM|nr:hypothetical protein JAAARDRAFT_191276 [Jaapia argillacea MUCL 33604]
MDLPLPALFQRALSSVSQSVSLPTIDDSTQALISSSLSDLNTLASRITALSLFSPNETVEDVSTRDLVFLFVPFVMAEVEGRVRTLEMEERLSRLLRSQRLLQSFVEMLERYDIVPESERSLYETHASSITDPAKRRETKIKQYKQEKEIRSKIEVLQKRRRQVPTTVESSTDFDLIASLLPSSPTASSKNINDDEEEDSSTDESLRLTTLLLLRLCYAQAQSSLESMKQEVELLRSMPPPRSRNEGEERGGREREKKKDEGDDMWKLDPPIRRGGDALLDDAGKPLQPFTILPSQPTATHRAQLQSQVFSPDHRLPTMTVDEYLEIERGRGKFISGGGPASEALPTSSEQLAIDSEQDGTKFGEEKAEEKRLKEENWARFVEANPRGAGNTMNRG